MKKEWSTEIPEVESKRRKIDINNIAMITMLITNILVVSIAFYAGAMGYFKGEPIPSYGNVLLISFIVCFIISIISLIVFMYTPINGDTQLTSDIYKGNYPSNINYSDDPRWV